MRFPVMFTRYLGTIPTGGKTLGTDALLTDSDGNPRRPQIGTDDNFLSTRIVSINGWPLSRVGLVAKYTGAGAAIAINVSLYVFEDNLGMYFPVSQSATTITPGTAAVPTAPVFFDAMSLIDLPHVLSDIQAVQPGTPEFLCIVAAGASPNGRYDFILGPELTTKPF
jgi:hypothetical protein